MKSEIIHKIKKIVAEKEISEAQVDHFLTLTRKYHERTGNSSSEYPLLMLFCDWSKHTRMDRNSKAFDVIRKLNDVLVRVSNIPDNDIVINELSGIISLKQLSVDINLFLNKLNVTDKSLFSKPNWLYFVVNSINIIVDCPLVLPKSRIRQSQKSIGKGAVVTELNFRFVNENIFKPNKVLKYKPLQVADEGKKVLALIITLSNTTHIVFPYKVQGKYLTSRFELKQPTI